MEQQTTQSADKPLLLDISALACKNECYRTEIWTGEHLQLTVMSIPVGGEVGLERHDDVDQFIRIEYGRAAVYFGESKHCVRCVGRASANCAVLIPSGTWHNIVNEGKSPLKLYSIYAPPHHPKGTVHKTKLDADIAGD